MPSLSSLVGGARTPRAIINKYSSGGAFDTVTTAGPLRTVLTGALTANTLVTVLSHTGSGNLQSLSASSVDATSRTHRLKVTLDGVVVFDATSAAVTASNNGIIAIGGSTTSAGLIEETNYKTSMLVEYASSLSETALTNIRYMYRTY